MQNYTSCDIMMAVHF